MSAVLPALPQILAGLYVAHQLNQAVNPNYAAQVAGNQARAQAQAYRAAQEAARDPEAEELARSLTNQLMSILDPTFSAISQESIDALVERVAQDIGRLQSQSQEQALRNLARRGLAGSSLVDQANVAIGERAQEALGDARLRAEQDALNKTLALQSQARSMLGGITADNARVQQSLVNQLLGQMQQENKAFANLAGILAAPYMDSFLNWNPFANLENNQQATQSSGQTGAGSLRDGLKNPIKWILR